MNDEIRGRQAPFAKGGVKEKELEGVPPLSFTANGDPLIDWTITANMTRSGTPTPSSEILPSEFGDLVITGEQSGNYAIPIICGGTTNTIYLLEPMRKIDSQADNINSDGILTRYISEYVITGNENWHVHGSIANWFYADNLFNALMPAIAISNYFEFIPYTRVTDIVNNQFTYGSAANKRIVFKDTRFTTAEEFGEWLAEQYENGSPVRIWYILATPTTENITVPTIPTVKGSNTLSVGTTVQPSSVYIKYKEGGDEMVTLAKIGGRYNTALLEIRGLSTDTKPTTKIEGMIVTNGSTYIEIDTGDTYMFDAENGVWHNITG